jgi:peroxiredoxin
MRRVATWFAFVLLFLMSLGSVAIAGEYNPVLNIGDAAPEWKNLPGVDGKSHSLAELKDKEIVVLFFTCNSCDVATEYEDRIIALARKYAGPNDRAAFVAVNVNKIPEDALPEMKKRAEAKQFPFVYLFDESQQIAKAYGATSTPEFFILDRTRRVVYMGGVDDSSNAKIVKHSYLADALGAVLQGKSPKPAETVAIGCLIRYERERRRAK